MQLVRINIELLHFHFTSSASDSSIGGADLIGASELAQASARIATMSKGDFIAVLPFRGACTLAVFLNPLFYRSLIYNELWFQPVFAGRENSFVEYAKSFRDHPTDETSSQNSERYSEVLAWRNWTATPSEWEARLCAHALLRKA